jgi:hypothetical protein
VVKKEEEIDGLDDSPCGNCVHLIQREIKTIRQIMNKVTTKNSFVAGLYLMICAISFLRFSRFNFATNNF